MSGVHGCLTVTLRVRCYQHYHSVSLFVLSRKSKQLLQSRHITMCWQNMIHILQLYTPKWKYGDYRIYKPSTFFKHESLCWHVYNFQDMTSCHSAGIYRKLFLPGSLHLVLCSTSSYQEMGFWWICPTLSDNPKGEWSKALKKQTNLEAGQPEMI